MRKIYLMSLSLIMTLMSIHFTTNAQVIVTEGFEPATFPPSGWLNTHTTGTTTTAIWERATTGALLGDDAVGNPVNINPHTGTGMAQFRSYDFAAGNGAHLITSAINLTAFGPHRVKFWMHRDPVYNTNQDSVSVYINTTASGTGATFLGKIIRGTGQTPTAPALGWYEYSFNIPIGFNTASNYLIFSAVSRFGNNIFIDDITVENNPLCSGTPVAGTTNGPIGTCSGTSFTLTLSGNTTGAGIGFQWQSSTNGTTWTNITGATSNTLTTTQTTTRQYRCVVTCSNGGQSANSTPLTVNTLTVPANDLVCNAIPLNLNGAQECFSTTCATGTSTTDPALNCSTPNNTVWYSYTPTVTGAALLVANRVSSPISGINLNGWAGFYTSTTPCPSPTLTQVGACGNLDLVAGSTDSALSPILTAGTTYYIMIDGFSGASGDMCLKLITAPPPPGCTTNITPVNNAVNVDTVGGGVPITWNAAPGASAYQIFLGTTNPPTTSLGTTSLTSVRITGLLLNTTYYWYARPLTSYGDSAVGGCAANTTQFTTIASSIPPPINDNCAGAITLTPVTVCPTTSVTTYNTISATNSGTPACAGSGEDDDVWFKFVATSTSHNITLVDSSNAALGSSSDLVHQVFSGSCAGLTSINCSDPNSSTTTGLIIGNTYYVRVHTYGTGSFGKFTICISIPPPPPVNDSCGAPITLTNGVGVTGTTLSASQSLSPSACGGFTATAPISDVWYSVTALSNGALSVASTTTDLNFDGVLFLYSGVPGVGCAGLTEVGCADATGGGGGETINFPTAVAGTTYYIRAYDYSGQGSFTITASGPALPISLLSFTGSKQDKTNVLNWSTASETNNKGFELQRSANSNDFTSIAFVNSKAVGGNSSSQLNYTFSDITPLGGTNYYRLKQVDKDGRFAMSKVVAIKGLKPTSLQLVGVYPNPVVNKLNVNIESPVVDFVTLVVTDMTGKVLMNKMKPMAVGDNNVELNVSALPAGSYFIKAVCANGCETSTAKFVKQ